jgi:hypothetical protein
MASGGDSAAFGLKPLKPGPVPQASSSQGTGAPGPPSMQASSCRMHTSALHRACTMLQVQACDQASYAFTDSPSSRPMQQCTTRHGNRVHITRYHKLHQLTSTQSTTGKGGRRYSRLGTHLCELKTSFKHNTSSLPS